ncbi:hypothetical protein [Zhaonella formicivorans]|jgi:hypothetical protein|uniref:hypothetical protein n=1 Tax=Zhaonella formicivorans TaxID=2528593 RepID=UPI001D0F61F5|nr:hypothetical protein [Zhaonella formicivorans]
MLSTGFFSVVLWTVWGTLALILAGGLFLWLVKKPAEKPTLAARMGETEAEILEEVEE